MTLLAAENEKPATGRFAPGRFWPCTWKNFSVSKDQVNDGEFVHWKLRPFFDFVVFQRIFSSWALAPTHLTIFIRGLSIILFSFINKVFPFKTFLVSKGLLCLYDKQNNTWLPISIKFIFSCSNRHLTSLRRSLLSYRVKHSKRNSISVYAHVLFSIYQLSQGPRGKFLSGAP